MVWKILIPYTGRKDRGYLQPEGSLPTSPMHPFSENSGTAALKVTGEGGNGSESVLKYSALLVLDLAGTPHTPSGSQCKLGVVLGIDSQL